VSAHLYSAPLDKNDNPLCFSNIKPINISRENGFNIEFNNISFSYDKNIIFNETSFSLGKNELTVLAGQTGSGKSTLADILLKLQTINSGTILISGIDIKNIETKSLRDSIAFVSQDTFLFNDTLLSNLLISKPSATNKEIEQALKESGASEFVEHLPDGINTVVGDRGTLLSGGERQRISIARALLKKANLIIFDEATSALDEKTETEISHNIAKLKGKVTILSISHRPEILKYADKVLYTDSETRKITTTKPEYFKIGERN
jgi:ABC-type multidrug transport system fused ATPase/permease subunit